MLGRRAAKKAANPPIAKNENFGRPGNQSQREHDAGGNLQGPAPRKKLAAEVDRERGAGGGARHHHAAGHRDQQRRNHGDESVAHREDGVGLKRLAERNVELEDADQESGQNIDGGDQDGGNRVALVEARGAVHGAVEFGFAGHLLAAGAGLGLVDETGVQVGIDGHLLAGQGVEGEAGGDFRRAHRAVADHDVLNRNQGEEKHESDNIVAANDELSEGLDDAPGRGGAFVAVQQDPAAGGEVERKPEEREQQKQAGKNGELRGAQDLERAEQHEDGRGNARRQQQIEHEGRQRHQHDKNQADGGDGNDPVAERLRAGAMAGQGRASAPDLVGRCRIASGFAGVESASLRAVDRSQNFGDNGVKLRRHASADFHGAIQKVREGLVFDDRECCSSAQFLGFPRRAGCGPWRRQRAPAYRSGIRGQSRTRLDW